MKICFISPYTSRGGAELSLVELVDALQPRGFECLCIVRDKGAIVDLLDDRGVESIIVPFKPWVHARKKSYLGRFLKALPHRQIVGITRLVSAIKRSRCDLVYSNSIAAGAGAIAAKIAGRPHIWHLREFGDDDYELTYDLGRKLSMYLVRCTSPTIIANSMAIADAYRGDLGQAEPNIVFNAVELSESINDPAASDQWRHSDAIRCILLGKILRGKGQEDAIRAMLHLRQMNISAELLLVGGTLDHAHYEQMKKLIERHDLADRVQSLGHCDDPAPLMKSADVVLMCSRREAFGRVTVEGMKLGKPVIGTRTGGTTEIIDEGRTGLLYDPGDAQDLARKIAYLHDHRVRRDQMGLAAYLCAHARFNLEEYGTNIAALIQQVIASRKESALASTANSADAVITRIETPISKLPPTMPGKKPIQKRAA